MLAADVLRASAAIVRRAAGCIYRSELGKGETEHERAREPSGYPTTLISTWSLQD